MPYTQMPFCIRECVLLSKIKFTELEGENMDSHKPIRVLNLFTIMDCGGAETMVMNYYRRMDREKIQFDFMVHRDQRGMYDDEIERLGGRIYRMPPIRPWSSLTYRRMVRAFYRDHPEYRIVHSHMSELGYYHFLEAEKAGVPIRICHAHSNPTKPSVKMVVRNYYKTRMASHITHRFTCGLEAGMWLFGKKHPETMLPLNNAIDAKKYSPDPATRNTLRNQLGVQDKFVVGHVGRFCHAKNHDFMVDVFEKLHQSHPESVLMLVGNDDSGIGAQVHRKVERLGLKECVLFLGVRTDIPDVMQAMDVFLFPSQYEGLSVASIEAQASGLPIFISDTIPRECIKTDLVQVETLQAPPEVWAERIWNARTIPRTDRYEEIKDCGFDIQENANNLQRFYLDAYMESE